MFQKSIKTMLKLNAAASGIAAATLLCPSIAAAQSSESYAGLEEIIVTAQKREQSLQDVPIAVTAVTQETLQANRILSVNDLSSIAPGVSVRPSAGGVGVPAFTIRGQSSYGVVAGSDKQVSIYLDGVYIGSPRGSIFELPDIARLEVLRGPQGTLFGRNATAGAVSVVTRDPTGEAHVTAQAGFGNLNSYRMRATADLPQMGPFSAYFSFMRNYRHGEIRNAAAGTLWDRGLVPGYKIARSPKYLGTVDSNSYFAAVKFEPSDSFKAVYKFDRNEDNGTPDGVSINGYDPAFSAFGPAAPLFAGLINSLYNSNNIYLNSSNKRPGIVSNSWTVPRIQRIQGHSLTMTLQLNDSLSLKNVAAYRRSYVHAPSAIDGVSALNFTAASVPAYTTFLIAAGGLPPALAAQVAASTVGQRYVLTASQATSLSKQYSNELQLNYTSENLNITAGAIWFKSHDVSGGPYAGGAVGLQNTLAFTTIGSLIPLGKLGISDDRARSLAAYAQVEFKLTPEIELVAGARVTKDRKTQQFTYNATSSTTTAPPATTISPPAYKKTKPNFLVGVNWTPSQGTLVYGKYSTSFVSGGTTVGIQYAPEVAKSFEVGVKADLLDRRLRTNLALFHVRYLNHQTPSSPVSVEAATAVRNTLLQIYPQATVDQLVPLSGGGAVSTFVQPIGDVTAKGAELEVTAAPINGLTVGGSLAYTKTSIKNVNAFVLAAQNGEYIASNRPKWTANAYASLETQPLSGDMTLALRVDGIYRSSYLLTTKPLQDALLVQNQFPNSVATPAHWTFNGRVALKNINFGRVGAELAVWGKNLTNRKDANSFLYLRQGTAANYDPARTYGAELTIEF